jgi:hypothetical protein
LAAGSFKPEEKKPELSIEEMQFQCMYEEMVAGGYTPEQAALQVQYYKQMQE